MTPSSLTFKTTLRFAALVTLSTALVLVAGAWLLERQMEGGLALLHDGEAHELLEMLEDVPKTPEAVRAKVLHDTEGDESWFLIQIHDDQGHVLFRSNNLGDAVLPDLSPAVTRQVINLPKVGGVQFTEIRSKGWHIQVGSSLRLERLLLQDYAKVSIGLVCAAGLAGLGLGYGFSRITLRPIRDIANTARRIGGDNLQERIPESTGQDELTELTQILNKTFDRLEISFEQVRRFSADASHELKTPLALIRLNAERLRTRVVAAGAQSELDDLLEAVERMQTVIERLLFLARADGGALPLAVKPVSVPQLVADFAEDATVLMEEAGGRFNVIACDTGEVRGDMALLQQLLLNLIGNAARVSPPGGLVTLEARRETAGWRIALTDEGPGLPEDQLERIFGRFIRYAQETPKREEDAKGQGLGLSICRSIAQLHGGSIVAKNRGDGRTGLSLVITLPAAATSAPRES